jgi:hypothetical protein
LLLLECLVVALLWAVRVALGGSWELILQFGKLGQLERLGRLGRQGWLGRLEEVLSVLLIHHSIAHYCLALSHT